MKHKLHPTEGQALTPPIPFGMDSEEEADAYRRVREYLRSNPYSNAMQIANATHVSIHKITKYVRQGLLRNNR
ncbi:hypothetical protein JQN58_18755 [Aneurinibacillus sp. BA2021]|nr:hypothetical protein [Aneurinibacillus sp. BA2021]